MEFRRSSLIRNTGRKVRKSGFTFVELSIACSLLLLASLSLGLIYRTGLSAWSKVRLQTSMLQDVQVGLLKLRLEVENSSIASLTVGEHGMAFLCATDSEGVSVLGSDGRLQWQRYLIYYYEPLTGELRRRELPLVSGSSQQTSSGDILGYVPTPFLETEFSDGEVVATDLTSCRFQRLGNTVSLRARYERLQGGKTAPEVLNLEWEGRPKNA